MISGPVVAVTGTNGKTSTKEMVAALLREKWRTHVTRENRNNRVGVPLTILEAPANVEALVLETGANERGEIAQLRDITEPTVGVITNVAAGHLEGFETINGVMEEKLSLLPGAPRGVVGMSPPDLASRARAIVHRVTTAGVTSEADVHPERWSVDADGRGTFRYRSREVRLALLGRHQIENAMIAIAVALECGVDVENGLDRLAEVVGLSGRCELLQRGSLTILNDTYNANPGSLQASLQTIDDFRGTRRVAILVGTMLELGRDSAAHHREMARAIVAAKPSVIGAVGDFVPALAGVERSPSVVLLTAEDPEQLGKVVSSHLRGDEVVLLKASRGVQLERAIPYLNPGNESPCSTIS
jgi:UDP-N-acetylmuramoyl-tripeptide--D-alanyl-D-alanine ligase